MPGKHIYVREIKLHCLTFINTAIIITSGTEGVLSTLVANGTGTVSTTVANGSKRVKHSKMQFCIFLSHLRFYPQVYLLPSFTQLPRVKLSWGFTHQPLFCILNSLYVLSFETVQCSWRSVTVSAINTVCWHVLLPVILLNQVTLPSSMNTSIQLNWSHGNWPSCPPSPVTNHLLPRFQCSQGAPWPTCYVVRV